MNFVSTKLGIFAVFSLSLLMLTPAYASVTSFSLDKNFYTINENIKFVGEQEGQEMVHVMIFNPNGKFEEVLSDPTPQQGVFETFPKSVDSIFGIKGIYTATAFTDSEYVENGTSIKLEFDGDRVFQIPDFVLELKPISDKEVDELKTVSFTVEITDSSVENEVYSLEKNPPSGATIDSSTGKFTWTPSGSHGNNPGAEYTFDIVVTKGSQTDRDTITITVNEPDAVNPEPEPEEKTETSYVDRYNDEAGYKKWFDDNYPEYSSIYQAVGLEKPLEIPAPFVDEVMWTDTMTRQATKSGLMIIILNILQFIRP
ncbi:fibronectin type III domain-containing protein [Marine Group I thaumarchaeote SCGC RSA3]|uniref:Fibronectin type III domain-containing protein n=1 Tax=Marine Group I thaumarchaeote SCGC RSA3 TaxID=1503183 RepID=A0A087S0S0_9ARCH|nr:fibronectin type III domain-containing protein [Marine Group I thaumarchaeote SCGC RSA3]